MRENYFGSEKKRRKNDSLVVLCFAQPFGVVAFVDRSRLHTTSAIPIIATTTFVFATDDDDDDDDIAFYEYRYAF